MLNANCRTYILKDKTAVPCEDIRKWGRFLEDWKTRRVARTNLPDGGFISTVFMGIDHQLDDNGPPLLFETIIFNGNEYTDIWRYFTWDEAIEGHQRVVKECANFKKLEESNENI